jgi:Ca2+-binding RTX toxin-like protein
MVQATANFGDFSNALLVGNFGDGRINAYDIQTGAKLGTLSQAAGKPLVIDGLWGLAFGNGVSAGDANSLYFAAGPDDETHGLFGKITANPAGTNPVQASLNAGTLLIMGSPDDDHVEVRLDKRTQQIIVQAGGQQIGSFSATEVGTIQFSGWAGNDHIQVNPQITATTVLDGGADKDFLHGGSGNNILLGGPGEDHLLGSKGRDLLIGGAGRDHLNGQQNDDLLIGGSTDHDTMTAALLQILAEWTSVDSYSVRIDKLRSGLGGLPMLSAATVTDDTVRDIIHGGPGLDWFWAGVSDQLPGKHRTELVN